MMRFYKINLKKCCLGLAVFFSQFTFAQEGIPVYADYLSDNLSLIHPSMAGAGNSNKVRLTARKQWFDVDDAPSTQSANANFRVGDKVGLGGIFYSDKNGNFSQNGVYATFAYHLMFSRDRTDLNMLSFGMSGAFIQSNVDLSNLLAINGDPLIRDREGQIQRASYFNLDVGMSYHFLEWFTHFTIKNLLPTARDVFDHNIGTVKESNNQRRYVFSIGRLFSFGDKDAWGLEPSVLYQATDETKESSFDVNAKLYRDFGENRFWGGVSYRRSLDGAEFSQDGIAIESQKLQYITPFVGVNYGKLMFGYTYSYQSNSVVLSDGGFHQITLGYNFGKRKERWHCKCPAVNN